MEIVTVQRTRTTVDLLLWRRYGIAGMSMVEETLQLNPGLADLGPVLPIGTAVTLPDAPTTPVVQARPVLSLFGED
jgi:phage tail protein X